MDFKNQTYEIWSNFNSDGWDSNLLTVQKTYVCALFSQLAYEHIPQFELDQNSRVKIIPCQSYSNSYETNRAFNLSDTLKEMDFAENFILESENMIVLGIKLRQTLFITIRGTQSLNDILVDADFMSLYYSNINYFFHSGFLNASLREVQNLVNELQKFSNCNIYMTGHSLGGAMAAILYNVLDIKFKDILVQNNLVLQSCYTFGMPRYGNESVVQNLKSPYQIYNPDDIVPLLPPKLFGYRNVPLEFRLTNELVTQTNRGKTSIKRLWGILTLNDFKSHFIERYCSRLKSILY